MSLGVRSPAMPRRRRRSTPPGSPRRPAAATCSGEAIGSINLRSGSGCSPARRRTRGRRRSSPSARFRASGCCRSRSNGWAFATPAVYASIARQAHRMTGGNPNHLFWTLAQVQSSVALVARMTQSRARSAPRSGERLLTSLFALPARRRPVRTARSPAGCSASCCRSCRRRPPRSIRPMSRSRAG